MVGVLLLAAVSVDDVFVEVAISEAASVLVTFGVSVVGGMELGDAVVVASEIVDEAVEASVDVADVVDVIGSTAAAIKGLASSSSVILK
jgi:hypothetical protein